MARNVVIDIQAKTAQYERRLSSATRSTETFGAKLGGIGRKAAKLGGAAALAGVAALGAAVVKVGIDAATSFGAFEKSLSQIEGLVGIAAEEVDGFKDSIKSLAVETATGPQELADALFFITSAGLEGANALDALEVSAKAAAAGLGDTAVVADVVTSAMNAYGPSTLNAAQATDVLVAAVREGKAAAPELSASLGQVIPIASQMGVSFDEVGAAIAAMTRTGLNAAEASTALKSILTSLLAPTSDAALALEGMGLSAQGLQAQIQTEGLFATLKGLSEAFDGNTEATTRVFGNVRALTGVMSLMGSNAAATEEIFASLASSTGALDTAFGAAADTGAFAFEQAKVRIESALLSVGEEILPKLAEALDDVAPLLPELVAGIGDVAIAMVDFGVAAVPPFLGALDAVGTGILNFQIGLHEVGKGIEAITNVADVLLGPFINIDAQFDATDQSMQNWLITQREMNSQLRAGSEAIDVAYRLVAFLGVESSLTAERVDAMRESLALTPGEMLRAGEGAIALARANGATTDELRIMESALRNVRELVREEGKEAAIAAAQHEILGLAAYGAAAAAETEAAAFTNDLIPALSEYQTLLHGAIDAQQSLADVMKAASDPAFKAVKAVEKLGKAEADLSAVQKDGESTAEEIAAAQLAVVEATLAAQGALDAVDGQAMEAALDAIATALGLSDDEARDLLETLGLIDGTEVTTVINVETREQRVAAAERHEALRQKLGEPEFASGGVVPGPVGQPMRAIVHGGEEILTPSQRHQAGTTASGGGRSVTVIIERPETNDLQGDLAEGLIMGGVTEQVDLIGAI